MIRGEKVNFMEAFRGTKQQTKDHVDVWVRDLQGIDFSLCREKC